MFSKYICINQETPSDCGAACLTTIARYMGVPASITAARVYTGTDQTGVSVLGLIDGAKSFGLVGKAMRGAADTLDGVTVPAIAHVVQNGMLHYVVLYKIVDAKVIIADPAAGLKWISRSEFVKMWTGVVLLFTRAEQTTKRSLRFAAITRFAEVIEPFDFYIAEILVASFLLAILSFAAPIYLQVAVDSLLQKKDSATLTKVIIGLMAVLVCRACLGILRGFFLAHVGRKADASIISTFCRHVVRLPMNFFQGSQVGNVISHLGDAIKIRELLSVASIGSAVDAACLACGFGLLLYYSVSLTLIMIGSVVIHNFGQDLTAEHLGDCALRWHTRSLSGRPRSSWECSCQWSKVCNQSGLQDGRRATLRQR